MVKLIDNEFETLVTQRTELSGLYKCSLDQSEKFEEQLDSNEQDLLKSYYSQEEMNPTKIVDSFDSFIKSKFRSSDLSPDILVKDRQVMQAALSTRGSPFGRRITYRQMGRILDCSASWASRLFSGASTNYGYWEDQLHQLRTSETDYGLKQEARHSEVD